MGLKSSLVVNRHAIPLAAVVSSGQAHESTQFIELMEKVRPPRWTGSPLKAADDKGYSYPRVLEGLERRGIEAVIPQRSDQIGHEARGRLDCRACRRRCKVENSVGWPK